MEPLVLERPEHPISRRDIDANVLKVLYRLINADHVAYLVGGGVRDLMVGRQPKDFDVATSAHPHEIRALFRNSRLIGRRFPLVHVFFGPTNIEVATFRRGAEKVDDDDDLLIRHDNTFGTPEEDAFRRDFTVNALFYDPRSFRVLDYVGGVQDLDERLIRSIGQPELRMREDPVRMLRAARLAAKLDFEIEAGTACAIELCAGDLVKASVPRLVEELYRTVLLTNSSRALCLMQRLGLLEPVFPTLSDHLKQSCDGLEAAPTIRLMQALGAAIQAGFEPSRGFLLACLLADMHITRVADLRSPYLLQQCSLLRARGFSRADTEQARLLLEALGRMLKPSRNSRRLMRRPYFGAARQLLELVAPVYSLKASDFDDYLAVSSSRRPLHHAPHRAEHADNSAPLRRHRRRRNRRSGRGRHPLSRSAGSSSTCVEMVRSDGVASNAPIVGSAVIGKMPES